MLKILREFDGVQKFELRREVRLLLLSVASSNKDLVREQLLT